MNLETERLIIRKMCVADLKDFYEYRSDPKVCEFQGYQPMTEEEAENFIATAKDGEFGPAGKWIQLAVELKSEKKMIGDIGLKPESYNPRIVEFGLSFSTLYQKKSFAKEALQEVLTHLFKEKNIHRVIAVTDIKNASCISLLERLNFRCESEFKQSFWDTRKKHWRNEFLYAMLEKDWKTN